MNKASKLEFNLHSEKGEHELIEIDSEKFKEHLKFFTAFEQYFENVYIPTMEHLKGHQIEVHNPGLKITFDFKFNYKASYVLLPFNVLLEQSELTKEEASKKYPGIESEFDTYAIYALPPENLKNVYRVMPNKQLENLMHPKLVDNALKNVYSASISFAKNYETIVKLKDHIDKDPKEQIVQQFKNLTGLDDEDFEVISDEQFKEIKKRMH